ncbi:MAG: BlaI/MecI/CopY family transcriptional regulator [Phenylobacterium sp.]|uniref:BlaI/MecI/CopY family transcriptional regulator n=1 Tax=Phenylobacterium sp. TaxID=1871053 RepID=UPI001A39CEFC|nr:BlaI/MecI/CopY family transcriptional regulator [Phenylobacterium sp.]MBL8554767.1 BlaI/MecI/CopY family transcriptional regulator [Phenylobacterium sp.]
MRPPQPPGRISAAESQVMAAVWDGADAGRGGAGAEEILAAAGPANGWGEATVRTLIRRLIGKGALASQRRRGMVVYAPLIRRQDWVTDESRGLLDRLFGGRLAALVAHFAQEQALDPDDLARLKRLVAELDADEDD